MRRFTRLELVAATERERSLLLDAAVGSASEQAARERSGFSAERTESSVTGVLGCTFQGLHFEEEPVDALIVDEVLPAMVAVEFISAARASLARPNSRRCRSRQ